MIAPDSRDRAQLAVEAKKMRELWASVVMIAMNDAIADEAKHKNGAATIASWARSKNGREVLSLAGIDTGEETVRRMVAFVRRGIPTTKISEEKNKERQTQDE